MSLRPLTPSLNTLGPTYSNLPETYMFKRAIQIPDEPQNDPMRKYKHYINIALETENVLNLTYNYFDYNIKTNSISCNIPEIQNAKSYNLEHIALIDIVTKTRTYIPENEVTSTYNKQQALLIINIPNFDAETTIFTAFLNIVIDPTFSVFAQISNEPS